MNILGVVRWWGSSKVRSAGGRGWYGRDATVSVVYSLCFSRRGIPVIAECDRRHFVIGRSDEPL